MRYDFGLLRLPRYAGQHCNQCPREGVLDGWTLQQTWAEGSTGMLNMEDEWQMSVTLGLPLELYCLNEQIRGKVM